MDRACRQIFAGSGLAGDQDGPVGRSRPADELINLLHSKGLADHAVLDVDHFIQAQVFAFQPCDIPRVLESDGRKAGYRREDARVVFGEQFETRGVHHCIDHPNRRPGYRQRAAGDFFLINGCRNESHD